LEGVAEDGTIEAIRIAGASAFALGVQWHAEVDARTNPANRALFPGFWSRVNMKATGGAGWVSRGARSQGGRRNSRAPAIDAGSRTE
jgi:hypothetical protein